MITIPGTKQRDNNVHYWNMFDGKFVKRVDKSVEGAVERINKDGAVVYELPVSEITGQLDDLYTKDTQYGVQLVIVLKYRGDDGEATHVLTIPQSSSAFSSIANRILSVDLSKSLTIGIFKKDKTVVYLKQDGNQLEPRLFRIENGKYIQLDKRVRPIPDGFDKLPTDKKNLIGLERKTAMTDILNEFGRTVAEYRGATKEVAAEEEAEIAEADETGSEDEFTIPF